MTLYSISILPVQYEKEDLVVQEAPHNIIRILTCYRALLWRSWRWSRNSPHFSYSKMWLYADLQVSSNAVLLRGWLFR